MTPETIARAARHMIAQRDAVGACERLPEHLRPADDAEGYAVQAEVLRRRIAAGDTPGGWKIACTTEAAQKALGTDGPAYGMVLGRNVLESPASVTSDQTFAPIAECELAVRLSSDVPPREGGHDADSIAAHVAACMPAIELAEIGRHENRKEMGVPEFIADDFFQRAVVLGPATTDWQGLDLGAARGTLAIDGEMKGQGHGRDVMGHPLAALAWLADALDAAGLALRADQVVLTGSIAAAVPIPAGGTAVAAIEGLGEARLTYAG